MTGASVRFIGTSASFVKVLAQHLLTLTKADSFQLAQYTVLLPNRRSCRSLAQELVMQSPRKALLLPKIMPLGDLDPEELGLPALHELKLPPAICAYERHGLLLQLILKHATLTKPYQDSAYGIGLASRLATDLAHLIDQIAWEGLSYQAFGQLVPEEYATHWQVTLDFLKIVTDFWPDILKEKGVVDPATYHRSVLEAYAQKWAQCPPENPVVAAGSTGSVPATAQLLNVIAHLPQGCVILPGLDAKLPEASWERLTITHPQYGMKKLLEKFGVERQSVTQIFSEKPTSSMARETLVNCALQPAPLLDQVLPEEIWQDAQENFSYLEAKTPQEESLLIALYMREVIATTEKTVALVTPDRDLAARVKLDLMRWDLTPDDSAGHAFVRTVTGQVFLLLARLAYDLTDPVILLALLKNKYIAKHQAAAVLEVNELRGKILSKDVKELVDKVQDEGVRALLLDLFSVISWPEKASLAAYVAAHFKAFVHLIGNDGVEGLEELRSFVQDIEKTTDCFPDLSRHGYYLLLSQLLEGLTLRQPAGHHPRLFILGPLEARTQKMDVMILGSLNEGTWPPTMGSSPWLNRSMRQQFGLPLPERRIGLSAHDFAQAFCSDTVVLTRATKIDGVPTVPSRWLMRLKTIFEANGVYTFTPQETKYHVWSHEFMRAKTYQPCTAPAPCPPVEARPRRLSVSAINMWMRDPYALYAKTILKLKPLDSLQYEVAAREKGILIHRVLELFFHHQIDAHAPQALEQLTAISQQVFQPFFHIPLVQGFWWPRSQRIVNWFLEEQRKRTGATNTLSEVWGTLTLQTQGQPFTVTAKADRIDCTPDGWCIIDYKTGVPATMQELRLGYACQLPLEAAIALAGGFSGMMPGTVKELAFWKLSGGEPAGTIISVQGDITELAQQSLQGLQRLIETFDDPNTPYRAFPRHKYALPFNDYFHLARVEEWNRQFDEGE